MPYNRRSVSALRRPTTTPCGDEPSLSNSILSLPSDTLSACLYALLSLFSFCSHSSRAVEPGMLSATNNAATPEEGAGGYGGLLLRKIGVGILAAAYVGMILMVLLVAAAVLGVVVVRWWVEEPVLLRERVNFDYTEAHPKATFSFHEQYYKGGNFLVKHKTLGVPVGHTFYVSLLLLMPESDYNRELGIFQVNAELLSNGSCVRTSRSSHPCMLQFRSQPIRLMRELVWGLPLLLGITTETQKLVIPIIRHKESHPRTEAIRLTLMPRSGTQELPQIYGAEIILKSHLPWMKEVLHRWKWTFYVWATLYIYIAFLIVSLCCFRPLIIPFVSARHVMEYPEDESLMLQASEEREERGVFETLKRRRMSRNRRKATVEQKTVVEPPPVVVVDSSATSYTISGDDADPPHEETEDSESICFGSGVEE